MSARFHPYKPSAEPSYAPAGSRAAAPLSQAQAPPLPPSPPRSRRAASETPSAVGAHNWWDAELPPAPASLTAILDSFRKSGDGDRELLLAILGAKKAEEERLTAIIQTRLTVIQARLSYHASAERDGAAAAAVASAPLALSASSGPSASPALPAHSPASETMPPPPAPADRASTSPPGYYLHAAGGGSAPNHAQALLSPSRLSLAPPPAGRSPRVLPALSAADDKQPPTRLPPIHCADVRDGRDGRGAHEARRTGGLEMLLDAGMQAEQRR